MDPKNLTRLADAAERAGTTVPDVLAVCTRGDDLHLDIYVTPPLPSGWPGEEWYEEDHLDLPHPDGHGFEGKDEPVGVASVTDPLVLPVGALRPWKGSVTLSSVTLREHTDGHVRSRSYVRFSSAIEIAGDLLEVSKSQWAGWIAQRGADVVDADRREQLTRRVTAAVQAAADAEFIWKTEEAATALSTHITVSRQSLSRWRSKAAERGLPVPARRRPVGRSRADLWLPDVGLLVAWADLLEIEGIRGRSAGAQTREAQAEVEPKPTRRKKRSGGKHDEARRRFAETRKKRR
jgi:hypothetical protein